jgi:tRNA pseudouridine65 synthase
MRAPSPKVTGREVLAVLHADEALIAVAKPAGELVHPGWARGEPTTMTRLRDALGTWVYPVHRLDRPTSGVLVMARNPETAATLGETWRSGRVEKRYLALVRGTFPEAVEVDHPVRKNERGDERVPAVTAFRRLGVSDRERCSLIEARPLTGRLHQIRRHLKHLSHPIVGDVTYGDGRTNRHYRAEWGLSRLCLHAERLALSHPASGEPLVLVAPLPHELAVVWRELGFGV